MTVFTQITGSLYEIGASSPESPQLLYFVTAKTPARGKGPESLDDSWSNPKYPGWYIFQTRRITRRTAGAFVRLVRKRFPAPGINLSQTGTQSSAAAATSNRSIAWLINPTRPSAKWRWSLLPLLQPNPQSPARQVSSDNDFSWGALTLKIGANQTETLQVDLNAAEGFWEIKQVSSASFGNEFIQLLINNTQQQVGYYNDTWLLHLFLSGSQSGGFSFKAAISPDALISAFGCEFRYARSGSSGKPVLMNYPFLDPVAAGSPAADFAGFNFWLHPLFPEDSRLTRLALDLSSSEPWAANSAELTSTRFLSTGGSAIPLKPSAVTMTSPGRGNIPDAVLEPDAAGFAFCHSLSPTGGKVLYLAPVGSFAFAAPPDSPPSTGIELMAGLFANEFFSFIPGDIIGFSAGAPAFSGAPAVKGGNNGPLATRATTSWATLGNAPAGSGMGYFNQPSESAYYADTNSGPFPLIVNACLSELASPATFPMVPYGGVSFGNGAAGSGKGTPDDYAALEKNCFAPLRGSAIGIGPQGPIFTGADNPARSYLPAVGSPLGYSFTPQGFLVALNQSGGWKNLLLAQSPVDQKLFGFFAAAGDTLNTILSGTLIQNQLFLVISQAQHLDNFADTLNIGGFNLEAAVSEGAVVIFKFNDSRSLLDLAGDAASWTASGQFVGDAAAVQAVQQQLRTSFSQAGVAGGGTGGRGSQDPFAYFQQIAVQPEWTGVLVFNALVDGNGMPPDLQILLAGIPGPQLRAHHFGVQANNLDRNSPQLGTIKHSSIFGVIHYQAPPVTSPSQEIPTPLRYIVQKLTVVFANSAITTFNVSIELTINRLFDRAVLLTPQTQGSPPVPENTIVIHGQYQKSGTVGHIEFVTEQPYDFIADTANDNIRVIDKVRLTGISLNPGNPQPATGSPTDTQLSANFSLDGQLWFAPNPFSIADGLDLLSFGNPDAAAALMPWEIQANKGAGLGLNFSNMLIQLSFTLYASGAVGPVSYLFVPQAAQLAPNLEAIRPGSLLYDLPLTCTSLRYDPKGLDPKSLGAMAVHCVQLESISRHGSPPSRAPSPFTTSSPTCALEFDLPLGSLGSLSSVHASLDASLFIAWGPSPVVPDCDAMAIMVKLPALDAGFKGFNIQGVIKTTFNDANLMKVEVAPGEYVYAVMFNNIALSVLGYDFPPGVMVDFILFAGDPGNGSGRNKSNIAWYLAAMPVKQDAQQNPALPALNDMTRIA